MKSLFAIPKLTVIRLTGKDRATLLHNFCTQDIRGMTAGQGSELFLTDIKGRSIAHGVTLCFPDSLALLLTNPDADKLLQHFDRYIIREDVTLVDESAMWNWFAVTELPNLTELPTEPYRFAEFQEQVLLDSANKPDAAFRKLIVRWPMVGSSGFLVGVAPNDAGRLTNELTAVGFTQGTEDQFRAARIACNWPWYGSEISEQNLPQEIDRDAIAISFTKGCYLGQETIARLDALGQIQKKLSRLKIMTSDPISDAKVETVDGKEVGWLTSESPDASGEKRIAFAFLRRGWFSPGTKLRIAGHDCLVIEG